MLWLGYPALLLPAMEDLEQHPYGGHGRYGTIRTCRRQSGRRAAAFPRNALLYGIRFAVPEVTPIAGHCAEGDRREPRPGRCGCRRDPRPTSRSGPRPPLLAPARSGLRPRPAGHARRERPGPGSRSSPSARAGRLRARRPRAAPGRGRTPPRDLTVGRTLGRRPGPAGHGRSGGYGSDRWGAAGSGCSERPRHYSSITLSDAGGLKRTRAVPPLCTLVVMHK